MSDYKTYDEATLRRLLETCTEYQERRKIRAAIREHQNFKTTTKQDGTRRISRDGILERTGQPRLGHVRSTSDKNGLESGDKPAQDKEMRQDVSNDRDSTHENLRSSAFLKSHNSDSSVTRNRMSRTLATPTSKLDNANNVTKQTPHSDQPIGVKSDMTSRSTRLITTSRQGSRHTDTAITTRSDGLQKSEIDPDITNINRRLNFTSSNNNSVSNNKNTVSRLVSSQKTQTQISDSCVMISDPIETDPKISRTPTLTSRRRTSFNVKSLNNKSNPAIIKRPSAVVRPFQSSTDSSVQCQPSFEEPKTQDNIPESDSCFIRNNSSRRSLPVSNKVDSHSSTVSKELKSNIRTSLPLVSLGSHSSPNFDSKPRPARRVSFKDETRLFSSENQDPSKQELKALTVSEPRNYKEFQSEKELQNLLQGSCDLIERKKIRLRIKEIRESRITGKNVEKPPVIPVEEEKQKEKICIDYDRIEDDDQLKQLLKDTADVDEKRKIRNSIRQIRRRSELEKVSAGSTSLRRSSSLTAPRRISETSIGRSTSVRQRPASPRISSAGNISAELFNYSADASPYKETENYKSARVNDPDYSKHFIQEFSNSSNLNSDSVPESETVSEEYSDRRKKEFLKNTIRVKQRKVGRVCPPNVDFSRDSKVTDSTSNIGLESSNENRATGHPSGRKSINEEIVRQVKGDLNSWNQHEAKLSSLNKDSRTNSGKDSDAKKPDSVSSRATRHKETFSLLKEQVRESLTHSSESINWVNSRAVTDLHSKTQVSEDAFKTDLLEKSQRESVTSSPNKTSDDNSVAAVRKRSRIEMESKFSDILNDLDDPNSIQETNESDKPIKNCVTNEKVNLINCEKTLISNNMDELNGNRVVSTLKPIIFNEPTTPMKTVEIQNEDNVTLNEKQVEENNNTEMICSSLQSPVLQPIQEDKDMIVTKPPRKLKLDTDLVDRVDESSEETGQISPLVSDLQPRTFVKKRMLIRSKSLNLRPTSPTNCAINVKRDDDGTIKVQQTSESNNRNRIVTITTRKYKTPSEAETEERDTVVETKFSSPGGSMVTERDEIHTKKRITSRGSNYFERSAMVTKRVKDNEGREIIQQDATDEKSNMSVTSGLTWGDRSTSRKLVSKAEPVAMIDDPTTKKSHTTLVLNRLDVSSGYGSVSGSEEDEFREEMTEKPTGCPSIVTALKDITTSDGDNVTLECYVTGIPTPEIVWYLNDNPITDLSTYAISYDIESGRAELVIEEVTKSSEGVFRCVLKNDVGEAETRCTLSVKKTPQHVPSFTQPLHDIKVSEGHSVTLTCHVADTDSVVWQKDGVVQKSTEDFKQSFDGEEAKLELDEVFFDDMGVYSCIATNDLGEESSSCKLKVTASSSTDSNVVPMFLTKLTNQTLNEGSSLIYECDVIGTPEPKIMWTRNGSSLPDYVNYCSSYDGRLAKLEIPVVTIKDSGRYEIVAENSCGHISMESVLNVQACQSRPIITQPMTNKTARSGDTVKLRCGVTGTPKPTISWRKNGMVIGQTTDFVQTYGNNNIATLEISDVCEQDSGNYEMIAMNSGGEISCTCQLIVEASSNQSTSHFNQSQSPFSQTLVREPQSTITHKPLQSNNLPPDPIKPPSVSQLRMQFQVGGNQSNVPKSSSIRRWHSLPPQENRFSVYKGETSSQPQHQFYVRNNNNSNSNSNYFNMSSYDSITDEDQLQKMMNETESFDEKKKIRARIRTLHEEQRKDYEKKRLEHEKDTEKAVRRQYEIADEEKARKMQSYAAAGPTGERESQYAKSSDSRVKDAKKAADEDKQKKLDSYSKIAESKTGGSTTTTVQKTTMSKTSTPMGMSYSKKPADQTAADLTNKILRNCGYGTSGQITVKTESWNSKDGLVEKSQKTESWGGGAKGAMNAFKQMDQSAGGAKGAPNAGGGMKANISRSPSTIKATMLEWAKAMTREYENVEVTNFSSSWNNGMAFCALIHHFYPDAFDFSKLDPKQRRANFNLAFDKAEELADIAPLLDVEDMVKMKNPDWKCVFTYVQSFYRKLRDHERNKAAPAKLPPTAEQ